MGASRVVGSIEVSTIGPVIASARSVTPRPETRRDLRFPVKRQRFPEGEMLATASEPVLPRRRRHIPAALPTWRSARTGVRGRASGARPSSRVDRSRAVATCFGEKLGPLVDAPDRIGKAASRGSRPRRGDAGGSCRRLHRRGPRRGGGQGRHVGRDECDGRVKRQQAEAQEPRHDRRLDKEAVGRAPGPLATADSATGRDGRASPGDPRITITPRRLPPPSGALAKRRRRSQP